MANGRSGTVSQIDTGTGEQTAADIWVDAGPAALAVTPTDVWVANEGGQSVSRISKTTRQVKRIDVDDGPSSIVVTDEDAWVANRYSGTLSRIDTRTNAVTEDRRRQRCERARRGRRRALGRRGGLPSSEHRGGTLVWEGTGLAPTVDPAYAYFVNNQYLLRSAYDSLTAFRMGSGRSSWGLVPDLATDLPEPTDGGRTSCLHDPAWHPLLDRRAGPSVRLLPGYAASPAADRRVPRAAAGGRRGLRSVIDTPASPAGLRPHPWRGGGRQRGAAYHPPD